jgi:hypothetical protein
LQKKENNSRLPGTEREPIRVTVSAEAIAILLLRFIMKRYPGTAVIRFSGEKDMKLLNVAAAVSLLNLPFGYWRANAGKFTRQWFLAVHLPVPFIITLRVLSGLGWQLATFPVMIGAFFSGQFAGGRLHLWLKNHTRIPVSACLIWDLVSGIVNSQKSGLS